MDTSDTKTIKEMTACVLQKRFNGSGKDMAAALNVSRQAVDLWVKGTNAPRAERADAIISWYRELSDVPPEGFIDVPRLTVSASAGPGAIVDEAIIEMIRISKAWLAAHISGPHNCLAIINARGDSMEPTYKDGDLLLVDRSAVLDRDGIYVFTIGERLFVKRLQLMMDGSVMAISDNKKKYDPERIDTTAAQFFIQGRVLSVWEHRKI